MKPEKGNAILPEVLQGCSWQETGRAQCVTWAFWEAARGFCTGGKISEPTKEFNRGSQGPAILLDPVGQVQVGSFQRTGQ